MKQGKRAFTLITLVALFASCGRFGYNEDGPVQGLPASDEAALVGCSTALISDLAGQGYGVAWHEYPAPGGDQHSLMFAHVNSGEVMTVGPVLIDYIDDAPEQLWLFAEPNGYGVFYRMAGRDTVHSAHINNAGDLLTHESVAKFDNWPTVVPNGDGFAVFHEVSHELYFTPLDAQSVPLAPATLVAVPPNENGDPVLADARAVHTATGYHLVFEHGWGSGLGYIQLDEAGELVRDEVFDFGAHRSPQIAADADGRMAVTWFEGEQLVEYGMDASGEALWGGVRQLVPLNRQESMTRGLAGGANGIAMVWESDVDSVLPQIKFRRFGLDGIDHESDTETISDPDYSFSCPKVAAGDGHFGIAFRGQVDGSQQLFVRVRHD